MRNPFKTAIVCMAFTLLLCMLVPNYKRLTRMSRCRIFGVTFARFRYRM